MYAQDYDELLPKHGTQCVGTPPPNDPCQWNKVQPYVKNTQMWYCPSAATLRYGWNIGYPLNGTGQPLASFTQPASTVLHGDTQYAGPFFRWQVPGVCPTGQGITNMACIPLRHNDGANFSFVDGHVKWCKYDSMVASVNSGAILWAP
jgi:prepilin-type processing-associated H-X9-DG protein